MNYKLKALTNINTFDGDAIIKKDNIYETNRYVGQTFKIMCDDGYMRYLVSDIFIRIDLLRDEKLNDLGI